MLVCGKWGSIKRCQSEHGAKGRDLASSVDLHITGDHITQGREKPEALGPPTFQGWKEKEEPPEETQEV